MADGEKLINCKLLRKINKVMLEVI